MLNTVVAGAEQTSWRLGRDVQSSFGPSNAYLTSRSWAAYVKDDVDLSATATRFSAGLRTERIERSVNALEIADRMTGWETGVSQSLDTAGSVYARVAGSYRLPNADELACTLANGCAGIPTVNVLSPQTSVDKEIGWRQRWGQLARMSVRFVRSDLHNEIAYDATQFANVNLDPTRREALELEGLWRVAPELELGGLVGVRRTQFVSGPWAGNRIPMAPQGVASLTARWSIDSRQSLSTTVSAVASQYIAGDFANQASIPAYWTADVHYRLNYAGVQWGLTIRNLFDRSYYSYATTGYDANYNPYTAVYPDPGRSLLASARVVF
jgi:iron complex outermembrane recepter protein